MATSSAAWKGDESGGGPCCRSSMSILFPSHPNLPLFGVSQWRSSACGGWPAICCLLACTVYLRRGPFGRSFFAVVAQAPILCGTVVDIPCWFDGRSFSRTSSPSFAFGLSVPILFSLSVSSSAFLGHIFIWRYHSVPEQRSFPSQWQGRLLFFFFLPFCLPLFLTLPGRMVWWLFSHLMVSSRQTQINPTNMCRVGPSTKVLTVVADWPKRVGVGLVIPTFFPPDRASVLGLG